MFFVFFSEFLNAVAVNDSYALYDPGMAANLNAAGINRTGDPGNYTYTAIGPMGETPEGATSTTDRPATYCSWWRAARFANWVSNGQPTGAQSEATTEAGAYTLNGGVAGFAPGLNSINPNTGKAPTFYIPREDEWYKAA